MATINISHAFDPIFEKYKGNIPVAYLRTLGYFESRLNPKGTTPRSSARGLMQVVSMVRKDYNERHGTNYTPDDLFNPDINVKIAADLLNRIVTAYANYLPDTLSPDWTSPRYVTLVTLGWNAGYSRAAGVQFIAKKLREEGVPPGEITAQRVIAASKRVGANNKWSKYDMAAKLAWAKRITNTYLRLQPEGPRIAKAKSSGGMVLAGVAFLGLGALILAKK